MDVMKDEAKHYVIGIATDNRKRLEQVLDGIPTLPEGIMEGVHTIKVYRVVADWGSYEYYYEFVTPNTTKEVQTGQWLLQLLEVEIGSTVELPFPVGYKPHTELQTDQYNRYPLKGNKYYKNGDVVDVKGVNINSKSLGLDENEQDAVAMLVGGTTVDVEITLGNEESTARNTHPTLELFYPNGTRIRNLEIEWAILKMLGKELSDSYSNYYMGKLKQCHDDYVAGKIEMLSMTKYFIDRGKLPYRKYIDRKDFYILLGNYVVE